MGHGVAQMPLVVGWLDWSFAFRAQWGIPVGDGILLGWHIRLYIGLVCVNFGVEEMGTPIAKPVLHSGLN